MEAIRISYTGIREQGFTLLELMIAITVLAIILAIGIPSFQNLFDSSRFARVNDNFIAAINIARSEAIMRALPNGRRIVLCERNSAGTGCSGGTNWTEGLMVLESDVDGNVLQVIRVWDPVEGGVLASSAVRVNFLSNGRAVSAEAFTATVNNRTQSYCLRRSGSIFKGACS